MTIKEERKYIITGRKEDLDTLEKALRHCEFLGNIGASRDILIRVDGDGAGRIQVRKINEDNSISKIDNDKYNITQKLGSGSVVGIYDIG